MKTIRLLKSTLNHSRGSLLTVADHIAEVWLANGIAESMEPKVEEKMPRAKKTLTGSEEITTK